VDSTGVDQHTPASGATPTGDNFAAGISPNPKTEPKRHVRCRRFSTYLLAKTRSRRIISIMKSKHSFNSRVFLIFGLISAVFISTVAQGGPSSRYMPPGHLIIDRVPNFGWNLAFNLQIDGRSVANVVQGRSYHTWLPAGPHVLTVHKVPVLGYTAPTSTTVNIQPGADHLYIATWDSGLIYLHPAAVPLTPGSFWQAHGDGTP
jgi:hypothetical protein